ncbi:hypothetical protein LJB98_02040 [Bacteroidales bacterium OttesenSCG-928-M11]|nr:hypothetical protein [Bacteroidales bacterium OttesenSCG-928-M11]
MKTFFFASLSLFLCMELIAQNKETTILNDEILIGKIKVIHEKYTCKNTTDSITYYFNEAGLLVSKESSLFSGGDKRAIYLYDNNNRKTKTIRYDEDEIQTDYIEYTYEDGNLTKHFYKHAKSTPKITRYFDYEITTHRYNKKGKIIETKKILKQRMLKNETLRNHILYQYDSIGNCIIKERLDINGNIIEREYNEYADGRLTETFSWMIFEDEDLYTRDIYEYNEDTTTKSHTHIVYNYGSTEEISSQWSEYYLYENKYDNHGKLVGEIKTTLQDGIIKKKSTWQYVSFDDFGNWTQKTVGNMIMNREIEYY